MQHRLERSMANRLSDIKHRKAHMDLDAEIKRLTTDDVMPDGSIWEARYRNPAHARRHILMDAQSKYIRRRYHRVARRYAKADAQARLTQHRVDRAEDLAHRYDAVYWTFYRAA